MNDSPALAATLETPSREETEPEVRRGFPPRRRLPAGAQSQPPVVKVTGIWSNHSQAAFLKLVTSKQSNIADREVKIGLPIVWPGPAPFKGARVVAYNSRITYISPGEGKRAPIISLFTYEASGIPRQPLGESIWDFSVLSTANPPNATFVFVPLLPPRSIPRQSIQISQFLTQNASDPVENDGDDAVENGIEDAFSPSSPNRKASPLLTESGQETKNPLLNAFREGNPQIRWAAPYAHAANSVTSTKVSSPKNPLKRTPLPSWEDAIGDSARRRQGAPFPTESSPESKAVVDNPRKRKPLPSWDDAFTRSSQIKHSGQLQTESAPETKASLLNNPREIISSPSWEDPFGRPLNVSKFARPTKSWPETEAPLKTPPTKKPISNEEGAMVGKKSGRALQLEEGLERTDNGMRMSSWPEVGMINQKNYYTEYMKRDDQVLPLRIQTEANRDKMIRTAKDRDRALARTGNSDVPGTIMDDGDFGVDEAGTGPGDDFDASKIIVIHPGSQNMRIGFASDALPKTIPTAHALKWDTSESDRWPPRPKRRYIDPNPPELQFGEEFSKKYGKQCNELKIDMRANKRKVLPNSKELVINYNRRTPPELIPEHNDPVRIEWTDMSISNVFAGHAALRVPDDSEPTFHLFRPIENGTINERDYTTKTLWSISMADIIEKAIREELGIDDSTLWPQYSCVFVIPDLYDKAYVEELLSIAMTELEFSRVCFIQESLSASFGAGYSTACIVDVGAQKTSVCCVEDGMCVEDSRVNLKFGGYDVTETFIKMMLHDHFPYQEINLMRRYDFLLAEELKIRFCTLNQADISVQLYDFHLRAPSESTRKYHFKTYDEVILAPMGFYDPSIFDNSCKRLGYRRLFDRSYNVYDRDLPDDPVSAAQVAILTSIKPSIGVINTTPSNGGEVSTPAREKPQPFNLLSRLESEFLGHNATPGTSTAGSPGPEGAHTPNANGTSGHGNGGSPGPGNMFHFGTSPAPLNKAFTRSAKEVAMERDGVLPIVPLDVAILTSIQHAAKDDEKKLRDLIGGIMVIGGGAKTPGFGPVLEERLKQKRPDLADKILVGTSPREMDGQVVAWKGASVFAKLITTNDSWISPLEYERLGSRVLYFKLIFNY